MVTVQRFSKCNAAAPGRQVIVAHDQYQAIAPVQIGMQVAGSGVARADADVGQAVFDALDYAAAGPLFKVELDLLMQLHERP